jgi:dTMP kinase
MFITFEGGEGSGKTTQIALLRDYLAAQGKHVLSVREPGGTPAGDRIRELVLDRSQHIVPEAELLLYSASRAQIVADVIRPHLHRGGIVLCDRYVDSTYAYQGYGRGLDLTMLRQIQHFATGGLIPDLTIFLDIAPEQGLVRRARSGEALNRLDSQTLEFHKRVREGYYALLAAEPTRWRVLDAMQPIEPLQRQIQALLG